MNIIYFAWLREKTGVAEENIDVPAGVTDVQSLVDWIVARGDGFAAAFEDMKVVRVAVNQEYVKLDCPVKAGDEVAFFPPVTGG